MQRQLPVPGNCFIPTGKLHMHNPKMSVTAGCVRLIDYFYLHNMHKANNYVYVLYKGISGNGYYWVIPYGITDFFFSFRHRKWHFQWPNTMKETLYWDGILRNPSYRYSS